MAPRPVTLIKDAIKADERKDRATVIKAITAIVTDISPAVAWLPIAERCWQLLNSPNTMPKMSGLQSGDDGALTEKVKVFREQCRAAFVRAVEQRFEQLKREAPKADTLRALARLCVAKETFEAPKSKLTFLIHGGTIVDYAEAGAEMGVEVDLDF